MPTKEELILDNELLKKKLALAEAWMRREVAQHKKWLWETAMIQTGRKKLDNMLERESVNIITRKLQEQFWDSLKNAPKFTLDHLIDGEIYWQTLQKFPTLDALPVVSSYQKVLDSLFGGVLYGFCQYVKGKIPHATQSKIELQGSFDKDIENIVKKWYTLSLGRWYYFFEKVRDGSSFWWEYEDVFLEYMSSHHENFLEICITEPFFRGFSEIIQLEVFGRKRHVAKIAYSDAKKVRSLLLESGTDEALLWLLFKNISNESMKKK